MKFHENASKHFSSNFVATDVRTDWERDENEQHLIGPEQCDGAAIYVHNIYKYTECKMDVWPRHSLSG
jgi:hypothetical protein